MPELPEVETTRRGIEPHIQGCIVQQVVIREPRLRWPIPPGLTSELPGQRVGSVDRRGKYLLLTMDKGILILHLGMSGSLRIREADSSPDRHDHLDLVFTNGRCLRLRDPRRFGAVLWTDQPPDRHPLLRRLGPEPLGSGFTATHLYQTGKRRRVAVKSLIMDSRVVVGVGNIYANEALFRAGIHPARPCNRISRLRYQRLADAIQCVLREAIDQGGTTLRDFCREDGNPGYFATRLQVYGREGQPCRRCGRPIRQRRIAQRSTYYCSHCQR